MPKVSKKRKREEDAKKPKAKRSKTEDVAKNSVQSLNDLHKSHTVLKMATVNLRGVTLSKTLLREVSDSAVDQLVTSILTEGLSQQTLMAINLTLTDPEKDKLVSDPQVLRGL